VRSPLDPIDRVQEVLFGLIMVLTFTGSLSVAEAGREDVRTMLVGALGCNLAWGLIDAIFFLMGGLAEKSSGLVMLRAVRGAIDPAAAHGLIGDALPAPVAAVMQPAELESVRRRLIQLPEPPARAALSADDLRGAVQVFLIVFLSTFPLAIPFLVMHDPIPALRASNAIAVTLLFAAGFFFARITGRRPVWMGIAMVILGSALVSITIALGG
jgi:hypothetical protein